MAGRKVEELVKAAPALACRYPVERVRQADDSFSIHRDGRDQRLCGIEGKSGTAGAAGFIPPIDEGCGGCRRYSDRTRAWRADIERYSRPHRARQCKKADDRFHCFGALKDRSTIS